jgi:hypothetical protein
MRRLVICYRFFDPDCVVYSLKKGNGPWKSTGAVAATLTKTFVDRRP